MSLKDQNIEELFRSGLEDAELPVNDAMWTNISSGLSQSGAATSAGMTTGKILTYIGLSGAACAVGVAATLFFSAAEETKEVKKDNSPIAIIEANKTAELSPVILEDNQTEDEEIIDQIILKEDIQNDPIITPDEKIKETKKVVTVSEKEKHTYKGSWLNDFLTPKPAPNTNTSASVNTNSNNTDLVEASASNPEVKVTPTITETVEDEIIASIIAMPVGGYAPLEVSFAHHSEMGSAHWDFGDGSVSSENATAHTFEKFGKYTVTLTVTGKDGKEFKDYRVIEVLANSALTNIPNIFTPNNDGSNDYFVVEGKNIQSFNMAILNTKGEIIYQSESLNDEWDGKDKFGDPVPIGTYVIIISAKGIDGKKYEHSGTVTIKR